MVGVLFTVVTSPMFVLNHLPESSIKSSSSNVPKLDLEAFYSHFQVTPGQVTSLPGKFRLHDIISFHVAATSFELQPCRSSNVPKT